MSAQFVVVPFGENAVAQVRVKELDGLQRIVAGKAGNRFVSLIGVTRDGHYRKIKLVFDRDYCTYACTSGVVDGPELNLAILPKGVCAGIEKDGELSIFVPVNGNTLNVEDKRVATDILLSNYENTVLCVKDGAIYSIRVKQP